MPRNFLDIEGVPDNLSNKVKQDLKFKTGNFVWRIKFNTPLDPGSLSKDTMYVSKTDGTRLRAAIKYDVSNNQIEVEPLEPYAQDEFYFLNITTKVKSKGGQHLKQPVQIKFKL